MIYFVQAGGRAGPIKIGFAKDPVRRLSNLRLANHETLVPIAVLQGEIADEKALHRRFGGHRIHGEWFRPADEILAFASQHPWISAPTTRGQRYGTPLSNWMGAHGLTLEGFGQLIGERHAGVVRRYALPLDHPQFQVPPADVMVRIYVATDGELRPDHFYALPVLDLPKVGGEAAPCG